MSDDAKEPERVPLAGVPHGAPGGPLPVTSAEVTLEPATPSGIHRIPADAYHADPAAQPSLSASIANILLARSPKHAWTAHPRLNPDYRRDDDQKYDRGTVAHMVLLEGDHARIAVGDFPDWRTKIAQEFRDESRAAGLTPLLRHQYDEVMDMVDAVAPQLERFDADPALFAAGHPEQTLIWEENGVTCRALVDWLHLNYLAIDDLKSTSRSANPESWTRTMFGMGADVQAVFNTRGVKALTGVEPEFRFVVLETEPPYALSVVSLAPSARELAETKIDHAIAVWRRCVETGEWPAYTARVAYAQSPGWAESQWLEREAREEQAA